MTKHDEKTHPIEKDSVIDESLSDPERLRILAQTGLMDSPSEQIFDKAVRLATQITGRPIALLSLVDDERQFFKAQTGLRDDVAEARGTPLSHSFCKHVVTSKEPLVVNDASKDPRVSHNGAVKDLDVTAYLGVPVRAEKDQIIGSLCVIDPEPHEWTREERSAIQDLRSLLESDLRLRSALRDNEILLNEFNHRIGNIFAVFMGMVRLAAREAGDVAEMSETLTSRLSAMDIAQKLVRPSGMGPRVSSEHAELVDLANRVLAPFASPRITIGDTHMVMGPQATAAFALVLHELATNAIKHGALAEQDGTIDVKWRIDKDTLIFEWCETSQAPDTPSANRKAEGFGTTLLKINIEHELGGTQERVFDQNQMRLIIRIPVNALAA